MIAAEITALSPEELTAKVAERIMGYAKVHRCVCGDWRGTDEGYSCSLPHFSRRIGDAWKVLERVTFKKGWSFEIVSQEGYDSGTLYAAIIRHGNEAWVADSRFGDHKDSVAVAICRVCLMVVEAGGSP